MLVHSNSSPVIEILHTDSLTTITFTSSLYFPAKDHVVREVSRNIAGEKRTIILDFSRVRDIDHTVALDITGLIKEISKSGKIVLVCGASSAVARVLNSAYGDHLPLHKSIDHALRETNCQE